MDKQDYCSKTGQTRCWLTVSNLESTKLDCDIYMYHIKCHIKTIKFKPYEQLKQSAACDYIILKNIILYCYNRDFNSPVVHCNSYCINFAGIRPCFGDSLYFGFCDISIYIARMNTHFPVWPMIPSSWAVEVQDGAQHMTFFL